MTEQKNFHGIPAANLDEAFVTAACLSKYKAIKLLLRDGADINAKLFDFEDATALHYAAFGLKPKLVELLIEHNANLNALNGNGLTPLMNACSRGGIKGGKIAIKLINAGADVNYIRSSDDKTALMFAVGNFISKSCSNEVVQELIDSGAMVDGPLGTVQTPLMIAARGNNTQVIELLLKNGANPKIECGLPWAKGLTAELLAELEGNKKAFQYLRDFRESGNKFT